MEKSELNKRALEFIDSEINTNTVFIQNRNFVGLPDEGKQEVQKAHENITTLFHLREVLTDHMELCGKVDSALRVQKGVLPEDYSGIKPPCYAAKYDGLDPEAYARQVGDTNPDHH
jgi:hypothetical protein